VKRLFRTKVQACAFAQGRDAHEPDKAEDGNVREPAARLQSPADGNTSGSDPHGIVSIAGGDWTVAYPVPIFNAE